MGVAPFPWIVLIHESLGYRTPQEVYFRERRLKEKEDSEAKPEQASLHHVPPCFLLISGQV